MSAKTPHKIGMPNMSRPRLSKANRKTIQPYLPAILERFRAAARDGYTTMACVLCTKFVPSGCKGCPLHIPFGDCRDYMPVRPDSVRCASNEIWPRNYHTAGLAAVRAWAAKCVKWFASLQEKTTP